MPLMNELAQSEIESRQGSDEAGWQSKFLNKLILLTADGITSLPSGEKLRGTLGPYPALR